MHSNVPTLPESLKVKKLIDQLKCHKITPLDVPNKYATLPVIAKVERELGILKTEKRGFDVLKSHFFHQQRNDSFFCRNRLYRSIFFSLFF
mgnify:CR=1 FL=1